jgi:DNA polymerase III epsilon subunit-like protein
MRGAGGLVTRITAWLRRRLSTSARDLDLPIETLLDPGFVAIDLETTGLDPRRDDVVAMAAIPFVAGQAQPGYVSLVDPGRPIPPASIRIHGIDDARVVGAPVLDDALVRFDAMCAGHVVVGHDVAFDVAVLARARRRRGMPEPDVIIVLDTRRLAVALHPSWRPHAELETVATRLGIAVVGRHTPDGDARLAGAILVALLPQFRHRGVHTLRALSWAQTAVYRHA